MQSFSQSLQLPLLLNTFSFKIDAHFDTANGMTSWCVHRALTFNAYTRNKRSKCHQPHFSESLSVAIQKWGRGLVAIYFASTHQTSMSCGVCLHSIQSNITVQGDTTVNAADNTPIVQI